MIVKLAWLGLALIHLAPAFAGMIPGALVRLYGVSPDGPALLLLQHRSALFLCVFIACVWCAFDAAPRPLGVAVAAISVMGFLAVYAMHGFPAGPLRTIAWADAIAVPLLGVVAWAAFRSA